MTAKDSPHVAIKIVDKEFVIACPPEARSQLLEAAASLNQRMAAIKSGGKVYGLDRIAVMAALNLTHELLAEQQQRQRLEQQLEVLSARIDRALREGGDGGT